jgi:hypothetical protein
MRAWLFGGGALLLAAAGMLLLYRDPRVRDLFRPLSPDTGTYVAPTVAPPPPRKEKELPRAAAAPRRAQDISQKPDQTVLPANLSPDPVVERVLLQILAAKGLSDGISIGVTSTKIVVKGQVASQEQRKEILSIVDRGRESRRIDATGLAVNEPRE